MHKDNFVANGNIGVVYEATFTPEEGKRIKIAVKKVKSKYCHKNDNYYLALLFLKICISEEVQIQSYITMGGDKEYDYDDDCPECNAKVQECTCGHIRENPYLD